jgi:leucyl aminopeptidase
MAIYGKVIKIENNTGAEDKSLEDKSMQITAKAGAIQEESTDLIVVNLFAGVTTPGGATGAVDRALGGAISELIAGGDFRGRKGETAVLYPQGAIPARRVLVVGLGEEDKFDPDVVRQAAGAAAVRARELGARHVSSIVHGGGRAGLNLAEAAQATVEGTILALYRFKEHKTEPDGDGERAIETFTLVEFSADKLAPVERGAQEAQAIARGVTLARDLVNQPANYVTPTRLGEIAQEIAKTHGLSCRVLGEAQIAKEGMGALLGVARGSQEPPVFIVMEHNGQRDDLPALVLVGKGITFDTGGISLKKADGMESMKGDMAGAAVVLGAVQAAAELDLPIRLVGLVPATENMPGGAAIKPGDLLKSLSGLTIEVINTDAEGRLILADTLTYAARYNPAAVIDLATLTGAIITALGHHAMGLFCNDEALARRVEEAGRAAGEPTWQMPLWDVYDAQLKSDVADVKNVGGRRAASPITAARFLARFAKGYPWAHLDIAGVFLWKPGPEYPDKPYLTRGGTGAGVRILIQLLRNWS